MNCFGLFCNIEIIGFSFVSWLLNCWIKCVVFWVLFRCLWILLMWFVRLLLVNRLRCGRMWFSVVMFFFVCLNWICCCWLLFLWLFNVCFSLMWWLFSWWIFVFGLDLNVIVRWLLIKRLNVWCRCWVFCILKESVVKCLESILCLVWRFLIWFLCAVWLNSGIFGKCE